VLDSLSDQALKHPQRSRRTTCNVIAFPHENNKHCSMSDVTHILSRIESGEPAAAEDLLPLVYGELRKLATARLVNESAGQTLQATALVHEAYVRLVDAKQAQQWNSRGHFFAAAAEAMRRILIDQARRKRSEKRGGDYQRVSWDEELHIAKPNPVSLPDLLALDEALQELEAEEPIKAQLVKLRYFAGVPLEDAARMLEISPATAKRYWLYARCWLYDKLSDD
jgi:RNA polymerase sigma factor (TIGR02999 family)